MRIATTARTTMISMKVKPFFISAKKIWGYGVKITIDPSLKLTSKLTPVMVTGLAFPLWTSLKLIRSIARLAPFPILPMYSSGTSVTEAWTRSTTDSEIVLPAATVWGAKVTVVPLAARSVL